jgi:H+/Cl- antiporter ClcA
MNIQTIPDSLGPHVSNIHQSTRKMMPYWISAAITALFSIFYARAFGWSEKLALSWTQAHPLWAFIIVPTALLTSMALVQIFSPEAAGSGIPQLLAAVEVGRQEPMLVDRLLSFRMIIVKFVSSCLCVAGGGIIGREGPMLQISAGIFNIVQKIWPKIDRQYAAPNAQSMILAGGAAGLASAFNTPLGGIIFAIEELAKVHISQIRTYVFHAVIIAGILAQAVLGNYLYFGKITFLPVALSEIFPLVLGSALIGIAGALLAKLMIWLLDWRAKLKPITKYIMTAVLGILVATVIYSYGGRDTAGSGREVIIRLLAEADSTAPFSLSLVRGFGNLLTYSGGVAGGIFAPALSTGAALGSWFSSFDQSFNHHVWILAGMIAFLTGLTRTPFTSLILVLEMSDSHNVIISLMLAAIIAQSAAKLIDSISFYEQMSYRIIHGRPPEKNQPLHTELS